MLVFVVVVFLVLAGVVTWTAARVGGSLCDEEKIETRCKERISSMLDDCSHRLGCLSVEKRAGTMVYSKVSKACSQLYASVGGLWRSGSGCYIRVGVGEAERTAFLTAAHCVMEVNRESGVVQLAEKIFVQNPHHNTWVVLSEFDYDGVADVAFVYCPEIVFDGTVEALRLASGEPHRGSECYVVGNPAGVDEDSMSLGVVRDCNFCEFRGAHKTNAIFVSCPAIGGNSGGPILNGAGEVLGVYTFGLGEHESFGGGSNAEVIRQIWAESFNKRFLGLDWHVASPFEMMALYQDVQEFPSQGVLVDQVHVDSPFRDVLSVGSLLMGVSYSGGDVEFGNSDHQRTPGVMFYLPVGTEVCVHFVDAVGNDNEIAVSLESSYSDMSAVIDEPLSKGWVSTLP